jgi:mitogen-activated protein kinase kinase
MSANLRKKRNFKELQLPSTPPGTGDGSMTTTKKRPPPLGNNSTPAKSGLPAINVLSPESGTAASARATLSSTLKNLDLNATPKFDLKNDELKNLEELGMGNGGSVMKVQHVPSGTIMAKKVPFQHRT